MSKSKWGLMAWFWVLAIPLAFGSGVSSISNYNPSAVAITGGTINGQSVSGFSTMTQQAANNVAITGGTLNIPGIKTTTDPMLLGLGRTTIDIQSSNISWANSPFAYHGGMTIASGFGTSPTISAPTTAGFVIVVGTGGTASSGVINMPAATTGWNCAVTHPITGANLITMPTTVTTTSVTFANYNITTLAPAAWPASQQIPVICFPY